MPNRYKMHSNFFNEKIDYEKKELKEIIELYKNLKQKNVYDFDFFKKFVKNQIELNYKNEFLEKKLLNDDEYIDLFNTDFNTLCKKWRTKDNKEIKDSEIHTIIYDPNSLDYEEPEINDLTIDQLSILNQIKTEYINVSEPKVNVRPDGTIENRITVESFISLNEK